MLPRLLPAALLLCLLAPPVAAQPVAAQPAAPVPSARLRCTGGKAGGYPCSGVDLMTHLPIAALGGQGTTRLSGIWGWTDGETGREYALVGKSDGTAFVDVTDPERPRYLGSLPLTAAASPSAWREVKVYADHALVVADVAGPHGMQVFDLRQLRTVPSPPVTFQPTALYLGLGSAHNVVVNEETGFAYLAGGSGRTGETCEGGLHIVDVRDPARPDFAGCVTGAGYVHDAQCVVYRGPDAAYRGREVCLASAGSHLAVVDVTDKARPAVVASVTYPGLGYVHQGWLTDDHRYFFLDDEFDETNGTTARTRTLLWDLSALDEPAFLPPYLGTTTASDHNQYVRGDRLYQANYTSGLRILDLTDPTRPHEAGFFDTYPADDAPGYLGAWSTYPFFPSGTVVVGSIHEGLFVLRPARPIEAGIETFAAEAHGEGVRFTWQMGEEEAGLRYVLEELTGGAGEPAWAAVGALDGNAGSPQAGRYDYALPSVLPGRHTYRLKVESPAGGVRYSAPAEVSVPLPDEYALGPAYPNPFGDRLRFALSVRRRQRVVVTLYDLLGRRVPGGFDAVLAEGTVHQIVLPAPAALGSGPYACRIEGQTFAATRLVTHVH